MNKERVHLSGKTLSVADLKRTLPPKPSTRLKKVTERLNINSSDQIEASIQCIKIIFCLF